MSSSFGNHLKVSVFGQSHGKAIGVTMDGLPAGACVDLNALAAFMARRKPGGSPFSTTRLEEDQPIFLSGLIDGVTCGSPLTAIIENQNAHPADYTGLSDTPRPGHADYTAYLKWRGKADMSGGGHFSGRLTAPLCIAGGIAKQILGGRGVFIGAHLSDVGGIKDTSFPILPTKELFEEVAQKPFPVLDEGAGAAMQERIRLAAADRDSVGGAIECMAIGLPGGLGAPMFDGVENRLAAALFGIPALKGVEFGDGFQYAQMLGSQGNDPFRLDQTGRVVTESNHCGGILGGITNGMPVVLRAAFKPTPSITKPQRTVNLRTMNETELTITGRHDPCVVPRAVPVVEAVTALVLLDLLLEE